MRTRAIALALAIAAACTFVHAAATEPQATATADQRTFAGQIAALSEPAGYFDTDNLISNESSYLQVIPELHERGVHGGAYIGVGPDQNFTYIAQVRPAIAYIVDIRRDNLLLHLFFKALFQLARSREEYLAMLFGRRLPSTGARRARDLAVAELAGEIDGRAADPAEIAAVRARVWPMLKRTGVPLSDQDIATITRFHSRFVEDGLSLQFQSTGRPPQSHYPTYRQLLLDTDAAGRHSNFLASDEAFQFVKDLQAQDRVVPVVGDLSGPSALTSIGRALAARRELVSAFYVSNVEFYLFREGAYARFAANLARVPHQKHSVLIRSVFNGFISSRTRPGDRSLSRLQSIEELLGAFNAGRIQRYADIAGY
ncbi:MAG: hypothetical protein HOQ29_09045 [Acidobacteria bacterium]|nr:hypothetical protein [Acidobacteriota bacterium]